MSSRAETIASVLLIAGTSAAAYGLYESTNRECSDTNNIIEDVGCGWGLGGKAEVAAAAAPVPEIMLPVPTTLPLVELSPVVTEPTQPTLAPDTDPFDISYWPTPDGSQLMILDGKYPLNFQHDDKWNFPEGLIPTNPEDSSGCMCGDTIWVTGQEYLTGNYARVDDMYHFVESIGGHESDNCGAVFSDRKLVGEALGFNYHHFNNLAEAEQFVTTVDPNAFVIIAQSKTPVGSEGFSPYGKHIIGLVWDAEAKAWRALDPNDAYKDEDMKQKEPEFQDIQRFWTTDQITNLNDVAAWTNPAGVPPSYPWQTTTKP